MSRTRRQDNSAFIKGKTTKVRLGLPKTALGYSPAQATASGAGAHGGTKRQRNRRTRAEAKARLRRGEWD